MVFMSHYQRLSVVSAHLQLSSGGEHLPRSSLNPTAATMSSSPLTTHVLDTSRGHPARALKIELYKMMGENQWSTISKGETNYDGRCPGLLTTDTFTQGIYKIKFDTGSYFTQNNIQGFYPYVEIYRTVSPEDPSCDPYLEKCPEENGDQQTNAADENETRGNWGGKLDFILSCVSYAVGLGNVWRFPFLCYENGGGAFLVPYLIMGVLAGLPLFFLEMSFGQFASLGCVSIWKISPIFKGLGIGMLILNALVVIYYNVIVAYALFYLFASFARELPWASCGHYWNTDQCTVDKANDVAGYNTSLSNDTVYVKPVRPSEEYFNNYVLGKSDGVDEIGTIRWQLCLCLLFAWLLTFFCLIKGIKTSGKVVYVTSTFPYLVLVALLIRGLTLKGAIDGIVFYIKPDISKLKTAKVWLDAAVQIFYSCGIAFGSLHTLSSYNRWHNNCFRDAMIVICINCGTSVFAGFVIFSVIGFMAADAGVSVDKVVDSGPGLAFIAYPEAIARMPLSPFWAIMFFVMVLMLGVGSEFCMFETVMTGMVDELAQYSSKFRKGKTLVTLFMSALFFLLGLPLVTNGGIYLLTLMNTYAAGVSLLLIGLLECVCITYVYGADRYLDNVSSMLGFHPGIHWKYCWKFISPAILMFVMVFTFVASAPSKYGEHYTYPAWADAMGWLMTCFSIVPVVSYPVYYVVTQQGTLIERLRISFRPQPDWGPALNAHRKEAGFPMLPAEPTSSTSYQMVSVG